MRLTYQRPHRLTKLHDELMAAIPAFRDRPAALLINGDGTNLSLVVPDGTDVAPIDAVVAAHDPTTPSAWETQEATEASNESALRDRLSSLLASAETAYTNWPTLTAAQKDAAMRQTIRAAAGLIRLMIRRLDTAG